MIRLRTFGSVVVERDGTPLAGRHTQRRRLALLTILAIARKAPVSRDRVLALLWPDRDDGRGRHALAQLLYELRRDMGGEFTNGGGEDLSLHPEQFSSDVGEFEAALEAQAFDRALALYTGPFLDGFYVADAPEFERWAEAQRARLASEYLRALEQLAIDAEQRRDTAAAVEYRRRLATADPLSARHALALMHALARSGDRAGAIRHAKVHAALLRGELEEDPDPAVMLLAARLTEQPPDPPPPEPVPLTSKSSTNEVEPPAHWPDTAVLRRSKPLALLPPRAGEPTAPESSPRRWSSKALHGGRARIVLGAAGLVALVAIGLVHRSWAPLVRQRMVVLGAIESSDSVLALAVREAVGAQLERTPELGVASDESVNQTLRLMKLPTSERLTEGVADDVALRRGIPLVVVGRVASVGPGAQIQLRLVDAERGETLASASEWARESADIVPAVARLADQLRARAAASPLSAPSALPAVTTASIEALRDYALARAMLARVDRQAAITYGEAALMHDSTFALAHYLLGDLLWYLDQEREAERHLQLAYQLSARLPVRERMLVRARYTQVVLDRPDSALTYWRELRAAFPREALGYDGAVWADLAVGDYTDAAASADSALRLDSTAAPQVRNRMIALLALRDTARALALTRSAGAQWPYLQEQALLAEYQMRGDWRGFERVLDSIAPPVLNGAPNLEMAPTRQSLLLSAGRVHEAEVYEELVVAHMHAQFAIRSRLWQARAELDWGASRVHAAALLHDAVARLDSTDLSPPATARLAEMAAEVAAVAGDGSVIAELQRIVAQRDMGRRLPSYELARTTFDAAGAFVRGDYATSVAQLDRSRRGRFLGRSMGTLAMLEAEALERLGEHTRANALYRLVTTPGGVSDDGDVWMMLRSRAARSLSRPSSASGGTRAALPGRTRA